MPKNIAWNIFLKKHYLGIIDYKIEFVIKSHSKISHVKLKVQCPKFKNSFDYHQHI